MKIRAGVMDSEEEGITGRPETATIEAGRIEGELDAAIVFAAGAKDAYQNAETDFGDACFSDAKDCYAKAAGAFLEAEFNSAQRQQLQAKIDYLRECLDRLRKMSIPSKGEAA